MALFALASIVALAVGFVAVSPAQAEKLIAAGGYYYMLGLFTAFVFYGARIGCTAGGRGFLATEAKAWRVALAIAAGAAFAIWCDPLKHKILFDEFVLQGTAFHMHATKEIGTTVRAYDIEGTWLPIDTFLDKRPYFFTFLVSLLHDFTGYRLANIFALNIALTPVLLALVYWLARTLTARGPALLAMGLIATLPLLGQQATGAGMELHNLVMLATTMAAAVAYLRLPNDDRLSFLVLSALLLAQSRYESVIFVFPTAIVILLGWLRSGRVILTWPAIAAPLLLVPYAWHNRVLSATPLLWQLQEGQTSRFSLKYLAGNLQGAWHFFFNLGPGLANSCYLSVLGAAALIWAGVAAWRWARNAKRAPVSVEIVVMSAFGVGVAGNLALLMFYYWSRLDDVVASRFALPTCLMFALIAALALGRWEMRWWRASQAAAFGLGVWLLGWGLPAIARHNYTNQNLVMREVEWEHEELLRFGGPLLYISNKSTLPFILWRTPVLLNSVARQRGDQIRYHLQQGTFREVIVSQALRPTSAQGDLGVDPQDILPDNFRLEPFAQKRFGGRWTRLSRLVAVEPQGQPVGHVDNPYGSSLALAGVDRTAP